MSGYTSVFAGQTDAQQLAARMLVDFHGRTGIPAREGNVETALIEVAAKQHADTRMIVNDMADQAMMAMAGFLGITRKSATPAAGEATMVGERGLLVPAGSQFATEDETVWELVADTELDGGSVVAGVVAAAPGPVGERGLGEAVQIGPLAGLHNVRVTRIITDGTDQESVGAYLDRAAKETKIMSIVPRLPAEFAQAAMRHPQVVQAKAVNLRDGQGRAGQPGHITVFVANAQGTTVDQDVLDQVAGMLNADTARPLGVQVHVAQPVQKSFRVDIQVWAHDGFQDSAKAEILRRVNAFFSPASWDWALTQVNHFDVARAIGAIPGVGGIDHIRFDGSRDSILLAASDTPVVPVATVDVGVRG